MNPDELHVVFHMTEDKIISVHATRELACERKELLDKEKTRKAALIVCDFNTAVEYIVQNEKRYA